MMLDIAKLFTAINATKTYTLKELFEIRDALSVLNKYGLADGDLPKEVNQYIQDLIQ